MEPAFTLRAPATGITALTVSVSNISKSSIVFTHIQALNHQLTVFAYSFVYSCHVRQLHSEVGEQDDVLHRVCVWAGHLSRHVIGQSSGGQDQSEASDENI